MPLLYDFGKCPPPQSPLTEEDEEPHDEGQAREDQAPFADSLVVLEERRHVRW